jgi:hypothetical protein
MWFSPHMILPAFLNAELRGLPAVQQLTNKETFDQLKPLVCRSSMIIIFDMANICFGLYKVIAGLSFLKKLDSLIRQPSWYPML